MRADQEMSISWFNETKRMCLDGKALSLVMCDDERKKARTE